MIKKFTTIEEDSVALRIISNFADYNIIYCRGQHFSEIEELNHNTIIAVIDYTTANDYNYRYQYWDTKQCIPVLDHIDALAENKNNVFVLSDDGNLVNNYCKNITGIHWGPGITGNYVNNAIPALDKNFNSTVIGISLNRQMRVHRLALTSLLYGLGLEKTCHISALHLSKQVQKLSSQNFLDHNDWMFEERHENLKLELAAGFKKLLLTSQPDIAVYSADLRYTTPSNDNNFINYSNRLFGLYQNSFVEIVPESKFEEPSPTLDEKFINCVYGCNFPIIIGPAGQVKYYEDLGFDMFRDIVDHSYDLIDNPIDRLEAAIKLNLHLFKETVKGVWRENKFRFENNVEVANNQMTDVIVNSTVERIKKHLPTKIN